MKLLSLEKLRFSGLTGKGIKVAVVDSGINSRHPHVREIAGGVGIDFNEDSQIIFDYENIYDEIGHGTACAGVIREKAPNAELYSVKIFGKTLSTYIEVLSEAIQWSIDNKMDIINLSLGTQNKGKIVHLKKVCIAACQKGIIIVAASKNSKKKDYPASFPEVIGVTSHPEVAEGIIFYRETSPINFLASGFPRPLFGIPLKYNFMGESFASAHLSGYITLLKEKHPLYGVKEIKNLLIMHHYR